jgi:membrane-associated phospholipid phosphatase
MDKERQALNLEEKLSIGMAILMNLLIAASFQWGKAWDLFLINCLIIIGILSMNSIQGHFQHTHIPFVRDWYVIALLLILFLENRRLIPLINPHDIDLFLIEIDRLMFLGHDPTILLESITSPLLTEVLQTIYASFYLLPFSLCLILYRKKTPVEFHSAASTILMGFYLSFVGYYMTPAIGPRFTLANQQAFPLSGFFFFDGLQYIITQIEGVMRDCCPSGHALVSVLSLLLAWRYSRGFFPVAFLWALLILFSTVYLRYHYVMDLVIGMGLSFVVYLWGGHIVRSMVTNKRSA